MALQILSLSLLIFLSTSADASSFHYLGKDVTDLNATELVHLISTKKISSYDLTKAYLENIESTNHQGPKYNAVIEVNPEALQIASALDAELKQKGPRGLLHGLPVLVKDNIDTADKLSTSAGSFALFGIAPPLKDAEVILRLREAGAIILGKTNMDAWGAFQSGKRSVAGWSPRGGLTRNPLNSIYSGCGSSTGSAASVVVKYAALALGTESNGSLICPAGFMGRR